MMSLMKKKLIQLKSSFFDLRSDAHLYIPSLQSHRGFRNLELPQNENTLTSIQKSYELGYQMVEFDVRLTMDKNVVLFHDESICGELISNLTLQDLRSKTPVDLLEDVFLWMTASVLQNFKLNIEIKSKVLNGHLESEVFKLISHYNLRERVLISSFNPFSLAYFRGFDSRIFRSLLLTQEKVPGNYFFIRGMMFNILCRPNALHLREEDWQIDFFTEILQRKIPIVLWTCNDLTNTKKYLAQGISGVISDTITPADLESKSVV